MERDVFLAGVRPGGLTTSDEIKMLVCYVLSKVPAAMSFAQLHETLAEHELVNYFELVQAIDQLLHSGHIASRQDDAGADWYTSTPLGDDAAVVFKTDLPASARDKAFRTATLIARRHKRESEVKIEVSERESGGFTVEMSIPNGGGDLIAFSLFCPTREECESVRRRFLNDPAYIYKVVVALLTGDEGVLGDLLPEKEKLF